MQRYQEYAQQNEDRNGEGAYMRAMLPDWCVMLSPQRTCVGDR